MNERRANSRLKIKKAIAGFAPQIAHALGGPLAGAAVSHLAKAVLGNDGANEDELSKVLENSGPAHAAVLRQADLEFALALNAARLETRRIDARDRSDARNREIAIRDRTPMVLGAIIVSGFFLVLGVMITKNLPEGAETEFSIMLGALATMTAAVVNYYFGSSAGSKEKMRLIVAPRLGAGEG